MLSDTNSVRQILMKQCTFLFLINQLLVHFNNAIARISSF